VVKRVKVFKDFNRSVDCFFSDRGSEFELRLARSFRWKKYDDEEAAEAS
jgi:hypothetical protein